MQTCPETTQAFHVGAKLSKSSVAQENYCAYSTVVVNFSFFLNFLVVQSVRGWYRAFNSCSDKYSVVLFVTVVCCLV